MALLHFRYSGIYIVKWLVSLYMVAIFIINIIMSLIFLVLAIIILSGKGDNLNAGYNFATKEEKET